MAATYEFQPASQLGGRLKDLTPEAFVDLISGLCRAVQSRTDGFFGGVNAGNISLTESGEVGLGDALASEGVQYTADQIEYLAPEVFWKNDRTARADVYSVGLLMYAWANGGCLPFLYPDAPPSDRAEALRRRMSGEGFDIPQVAHSLGSIIEKATEFSPDDRYQSCGELLEAFQVFAGEVKTDHELIAGHVETQRRNREEEEQMMAGILAAAESAAAMQNNSIPELQKDAPRTYPPVGAQATPIRTGRPIVIVLMLAAILMIAAVAMQFTDRQNHEQMRESPSPTLNVADPSPIFTGTPTPDTTPDTTPDVTTQPTPSPTPAPTPTPTPTPTPSPSGPSTSSYTLYVDNVSWNQAADKCMELGGNLVVINNKDEFDQVTALADTYGVSLVWVGGFRKDDQILWVNGETSDYYPWAPGEPSVRDSDGTAEPFLMLWKINGVWYYNDNRDDPISAYPAAYQGKVAYICERP